jgi:L-methionine (R)-S-oxide reductase
MAATDYDRLRTELVAVFEGERDLIANMANCAALLFETLPDLNWVGFYRTIGSDLVLGPFQGRPACVRIGPGRGVCGAAAAKRETIVVPDVHRFPGHIACDAQSRSEIVVPLIVAGRLIGVLDLDSPEPDRFDQADAAGLEAIAAALLAASDIPEIPI